MIILRQDNALIDAVSNNRNTRKILLGCIGATLAMAALYGLAFGIWRSPLQACYSAVKMPLLFLSTIMVSTTANATVSQVLGADLSFRQVLLCISLSMAITAVLLGAFSPVAFFFSLQCPDTSVAYPWLLAAHTAMIGLCGTLGLIRLHGLLRALTHVPNRILTTWFLISGFSGCQLSWILSPFLAMPGHPEPFLNPAAFSGNFYEYLWHTVARGI